LTAREIAERVLAAAKMTNPNKAALADLNHQIVPQESRWQGRAAHQRGQPGEVALGEQGMKEAAD
jgi:hypothetical protein